MELLALLLPLGLLLALSGGGGGDTVDEEVPPDPPDTPEGITEGSDLPDVLQGGDENLGLIFGDDGDDTLRGGAGRDILLGEGDDDEISGDFGNDSLLGGDGDDLLYGGLDSDLLIDGAGNDLLKGGFGGDALIAINGADTLDGGAGGDYLSSVDLRPGETPSSILLQLPPESISVSVGNAFGTDVWAQYDERLDAGIGLSTADPAADLAYGGAGNDFFFCDSGDTLFGGEGVDFFRVFPEIGDAPVTVADFDPALERIGILVTGEGTQTLSVVDGPDGAEVQMDGATVAVIAGFSASDIDPGSVILQRFLG